MGLKGAGGRGQGSGFRVQGAAVDLLGAPSPDLRPATSDPCPLNPGL